MLTRKEALILFFSSCLTALIGIFLFRNVRRLCSPYLLDFKELIGDIAEAIIPETNIPGAKSAGVVEYIINVVGNCTSRRDRKVFIYGLQKLESHCLKNYEHSFSHCDIATQNSILQQLERKASIENIFLYKVRNKIFGQPFFVQIRNLTVEGYFSSEQGVKYGLNHNPTSDNLSCDISENRQLV